MNKLAAVTTALTLACAACAVSPQESTQAKDAEANKAAVVEACKHPPEYQCVDTPITVSMRHGNGTPYSLALPAPTPLIVTGDVYVFSGQTVYVEADVADDKLVNLTLVPAILHPEKTLTLKL